MRRESRTPCLAYQMTLETLSPFLIRATAYVLDQHKLPNLRAINTAIASKYCDDAFWTMGCCLSTRLQWLHQWHQENSRRVPGCLMSNKVTSMPTVTHSDWV